MDEIFNYIDMNEEEKIYCLNNLYKIGFKPRAGNIQSMKKEMDSSVKEKLPQYLFVKRKSELIGYMFLIGEKQSLSKIFPWWAVSNNDELQLETDLRLLDYGINICKCCKCFKLAERLESDKENHKNGIGRKEESISI